MIVRSPFLSYKPPVKKYKVTGIIDSDKSKKEIENILSELGFFMFRLEEGK